jgi:hypothetical protein
MEGSYKGNTFQLVRSSACSICGQTSHLLFDCPVGAKLLSNSLMAFSFIRTDHDDAILLVEVSTSGAAVKAAVSPKKQKAKAKKALKEAKKAEA